MRGHKWLRTGIFITTLLTETNICRTNFKIERGIFYKNTRNIFVIPKTSHDGLVNDLHKKFNVEVSYQTRLLTECNYQKI